MEDLWRSFIDRGSLRQDAGDAVLHEQALLDALALRYIDESSDVLDQRPSLVENRMPERLQVSDRSIVLCVPVIQYHFGFVADCALKSFFSTDAIFRVRLPN